MAVSILTLRDHLAGVPDARVVAPGRRDEELGQFGISPEESVAYDAELVEDRPFTAIPVSSNGDSGFTHFLDGAQKSKIVGYAGFAPLMLAHTSAGIFERRDREIVPPDTSFYSGELELVVPESGGVPPLPGLGYITVGIGLQDTEIVAKDRMMNAISARRDERETEIARGYKDGRLLIDGGIGKVLERVTRDVWLVGVVKSHQRQYFASRDRRRVVQDLKPGERTPAFLRERNQKQGKEAYSFYLRLFDSDGQSPLFGLIRVEIPASQEMLGQVDEISGWMMAERSPLSLPDARYDRMIYPIRLVEQHLKARQPSDASLRAILGI
ncbi:MAG: hypothetical protein QOJ65_2050 [Fimbriimonadaceae bacterium]|jgi:hypothetical protein|nr:hypothetical protein [Fimbriimonadaceae bacterium]